MEIELLDADGHPVAPFAGERQRRTRRPAVPILSSLGVGVFTALVLIVLSGVLDAVARDRIEAQIDSELRAQTERIALLLEDNDVSRAVVDLPDDLAVQVMQSPGVVVASTPGLGSAPILAGLVRRGVVTFADATVVVDGEPSPHRVGSMVLPTPPGVSSGTLVVTALPDERADRILVRVRLGSALGVVMGTVAAAWSAWRSASRRRAAATATIASGSASR